MGWSLSKQLLRWFLDCFESWCYYWGRKQGVIMRQAVRNEREWREWRAGCLQGWCNVYIVVRTAISSSSSPPADRLGQRHRYRTQGKGVMGWVPAKYVSAWTFKATFKLLCCYIWSSDVHKSRCFMDLCPLRQIKLVFNFFFVELWHTKPHLANSLLKN